MIKQMITASLLLTLYSIIGTGLVAYTSDATKAQIAANEKGVLVNGIGEVLSADRYDNDITSDKITLTDPANLGTPSPVTIYRARKGDTPVAAVITTEAPEGYSGAIKLLISVNADGTLGGVRVISHAETPGLGDKVETSKSDWILGFAGKSLNDPKPDSWGVKKDGGVFDQFSGATITPRAIVKSIKTTLIYFKDNSDNIFSQPSDADKAKG